MGSLLKLETADPYVETPTSPTLQDIPQAPGDPCSGWDSDTLSSGSCATVSPDQVKEIKTEGKRTIVRQGKQVVFRDEDSTGNDEDIMVDSDDDSWDLVTCFCMKPFAGRPMIECNECHTWIHLSCAKIRKSNVPEVFVCQKCRDSKFDIRRSNRSRMGSRKLFLD
nr:PHD finger protein 13 [Rousettus aegyptiacus]